MTTAQFNMLGKADPAFPTTAPDPVRDYLTLVSTAAKPEPTAPAPLPPGINPNHPSILRRKIEAVVETPPAPAPLPDYEEVASLENESGLTMLRITAYRRQTGPFAVGVNFAVFRERNSMTSGTSWSCLLSRHIPRGEVGRLCDCLEGTGLFVSDHGNYADYVRVDVHHAQAFAKNRSVGTFRFGYGNAKKVAADLRRIFAL